MTALLRNGKKAEAVNLYGRISKAQVKASPDPLSPNRTRDPNPKPGPNPSPNPHPKPGPNLSPKLYPHLCQHTESVRYSSALAHIPYPRRPTPLVLDH